MKFISIPLQSGARSRAGRRHQDPRTGCPALRPLGTAGAAKALSLFFRAAPSTSKNISRPVRDLRVAWLRGGDIRLALEQGLSERALSDHRKGHDQKLLAIRHKTSLPSWSRWGSPDCLPPSAMRSAIPWAGANNRASARDGATAGSNALLPESADDRAAPEAGSTTITGPAGAFVADHSAAADACVPTGHGEAVSSENFIGNVLTVSDPVRYARSAAVLQEGARSSVSDQPTIAWADGAIRLRCRSSPSRLPPALARITSADLAGGAGG